MMFTSFIRFQFTDLSMYTLAIVIGIMYLLSIICMFLVYKIEKQRRKPIITYKAQYPDVDETMYPNMALKITEKTVTKRLVTNRLLPVSKILILCVFVTVVIGGIFIGICGTARVQGISDMNMKLKDVITHIKITAEH